MSVVLWWYHLRGSGVVAPPAAPGGGGHMPRKRKTVWIPEDSSLPKPPSDEAVFAEKFAALETVADAAERVIESLEKVPSLVTTKPEEKSKQTHIERIVML